MKLTIFKTACIAAATLLTLASCSEKQAPSENIDKSFNVIVTAEKGESVIAYTKSLSLSDNNLTLNTSFESGDKLYVCTAPNMGGPGIPNWQTVGVLTTTESGETVTFTGTIDGSFRQGQYFAFSYNRALDFDFTGQDGTIESIESNNDTAVAFTYVSGIDDENIYFPALTLGSQQAVIKFNLKDEDGQPIIPTTFTVSGSPAFTQKFSPNNGMTLNEGDIVVTPSGQTSEIFVALCYNMGSPYPGSNTITFTAVTADGTYTKTVENVTIMLNNYYAIDLTMAKQ